MERSVSRLIEMAKSVKITDEQRREQRRSFVFGNTAFENPLITRELVDVIDAEMDADQAANDRR